jgi:2-oxoglutarate/2-oxoacid ferredoxin oxidoreductase subunit beta
MTIRTDTTTQLEHPLAHLLRTERFPHIWCPTCGIGTVVKCFAEAIDRAGMDYDRMAIVSGIGCTGRVAGYMKLDSYHTTHGRAIPFATGLKLANRDLKVVVFSGDGDLSAIGGNHLIHAARRNMDIMVVCLNNFIYGMTGGQVAPTTPQPALTSTTPHGAFEPPFSLPHLLEACGAVYIARWTSLHVRRLTKSLTEALLKPGFSFVEAIAPCSTLYARRNRLGSGLDLMKYYHDSSEIEHGADTSGIAIDFQKDIKVGKFLDVERPTWHELSDRQHHATLGDRYYRAAQMPPAEKEEASHAQN